MTLGNLWKNHVFTPLGGFYYVLCWVLFCPILLDFAPFLRHFGPLLRHFAPFLPHFGSLWTIPISLSPLLSNRLGSRSKKLVFFLRYPNSCTCILPAFFGVGSMPVPRSIGILLHQLYLSAKVVPTRRRTRPDLVC